MKMFICVLSLFVIIIKSGKCQLVPIYIGQENEKIYRDDEKNQGRNYTQTRATELKAIHRKAKNISHSKGSIVQDKNGNFDYRRSIKLKISSDTKSLAASKYTSIIHSNPRRLPEALKELEYLVHQYEIAIDFTNSGGLELMMSLMKRKDKKIVKAASSVIQAAMQGNPEVKAQALQLGMSEFLLKGLENKDPHAIFLLSAYLRNTPKIQEIFFKDNKGFILLDSLLNNKTENIRSKLKVVDLLSDLAAEICTIPKEDQNKQIVLLQRRFESSIKKSGICKSIPQFLIKYDDFVIHEKVISVMNLLYDSCKDHFQEEYVLNAVYKLYNHYRLSKKMWYSAFWDSVSSEFQVILYDNIQTLHENLNRDKKKHKTEL